MTPNRLNSESGIHFESQCTHHPYSKENARTGQSDTRTSYERTIPGAPVVALKLAAEPPRRSPEHQPGFGSHLPSQHSKTSDRGSDRGTSALSVDRVPFLQLIGVAPSIATAGGGAAPLCHPRPIRGLAHPIQRETRGSGSVLPVCAPRGGRGPGERGPSQRGESFLPLQAASFRGA